MSDFSITRTAERSTNSIFRSLELLSLHRPDTRAHFVQFYEDDAFLLENIALVAAKTLSAGDAAVLIPTASHLNDIEKRLVGRGFDLDGLRAAGRYAAFDAEETLARLVVHDWPNDDRFNEIIGGIIRRTSDKSSNHFAFAFGEMVAVLCAADKPDAAVRLEQLWNALIDKHSFSLCCAYPLSSFASESGLNAIFPICEEHSLTIPAEIPF